MGGVPRSVPFMSAGNADAQAQVKRMNLRYAGVCRTCGVELPAGTRAVYEKSTKTVLCLRCADTRTQRPVAVEEAATAEPALNHLDGVAGSSARREHERRKAARERRIRERHPKLGGVLLALSEDPQSTRAWAVGADGEERLGRRLDSVAGALVRVLHDRGIPGSRANLDHIVVCPSGVFVIDAKRYKGRPHLRKEGGLFIAPQGKADRWHAGLYPSGRQRPRPGRTRPRRPGRPGRGGWQRPVFRACGLAIDRRGLSHSWRLCDLAQEVGLLVEPAGPTR